MFDPGLIIDVSPSASRLATSPSVASDNYLERRVCGGGDGGQFLMSLTSDSRQITSRIALNGGDPFGNLFVEPYLVTLLPGADPYVTFQHPGPKLLYFLSGEVMYRYGGKSVVVGAGDSLLFDATALHGIEAIQTQPVSYLSVALTLRE